MKKFKNLEESPDILTGCSKFGTSRAYHFIDDYFEREAYNYRLSEKTFDLDKDVDFIYKKCFKNLFDVYKHTGVFPVMEEVKTGQIHSSELKSKDAKEAHEKSPIVINCGIYNEGNLISLKDKYILLTVDLSMLKMFFYQREKLSKNDLKQIEHTLTEESMKASIYHELSHWVSNAKYNDYLYKLIMKGKNYDLKNPKDRKKVERIYNLNKQDRYLTNYEIDAVIHAIKQVKRNNKDWDKMSLVDLFYKYSSLRTTAKRLYSIDKNVYKLWIQDIVKRMHRENLLGKNMKKFPDFKMIEQFEIAELCFI